MNAIPPLPVIPSPLVAPPVHLRWLYQRDLPEVLAIEAAGSDDPWTEADFLERLRRPNCIGIVAEAIDGYDGSPNDRPAILGFSIYELRPDRITLLNFAVHPDHRRANVGRRMIGRLVGKLTPGKRTRLVAHVGEGNLSAHLFLRSCGLRAVRVERGMGG